MSADTERSKSRNRKRNRHQKQAVSKDALAKQGEAPINGVELTQYAKIKGVSEDNVWEWVRLGRLFARANGDKLLVFENRPGATYEPDLPPLDANDCEEEGRFDSTLSESNGWNSKLPTISHSPEMALLLDHLSLAKEENRDIIKLTQESLTKITDMSEQLLASKDELLSAKQLEVERYKEQLEAARRELEEVRQEKEDLETLVATIKDNDY